jgi:hypothetical protein
MIEAWRRRYHAVRPHSSLGYRPAAPETIVTRDKSIVPWASAPAVEGARAHPNRGVKQRHALTLNLDHPSGAGQWDMDASGVRKDPYA